MTDPKMLESIGFAEKPAEKIWKESTGDDKCCKCGGVAQETVAGGMWRCTFTDCGYFMTDETINTGPTERKPYVPSIAELERAVVETALTVTLLSRRVTRSRDDLVNQEYNVARESFQRSVDALLKAREK